MARDFPTEAVPIVLAETAIELVNRLQMQTLAWRFVFNAEKLPLEEQLALSIVAAQSYTQEGDAPTTSTREALERMLDFSQSKGGRILRDLQLRYLRQDQNEDNHKVFHWRIKDLETAEKFDELAVLLGQIEQVILIQKSNPTNPNAGCDLLPEEIYFNIVGNRARHQKQKEEL